MYPGDMRATILVHVGGVDLVKKKPVFSMFLSYVLLFNQIQICETPPQSETNIFQLQHLTLESRVSTRSLWFFVECVVEKNVCSFKKSLDVLLEVPPHVYMLSPKKKPGLSKTLSESSSQSSI